MAFDRDQYLKDNPDVAASEKYGSNPYQHYLDWGRAEGRAAPQTTPITADKPDMTVPKKLTSAQTVKPVLQEVKEEELISAPQQVGPVSGTVQTAGTPIITGTPTAGEVPQVEAETVADKMAGIDAVQGAVSEEAIISPEEAYQGKLSEDAIAKAVTAEVPKEATVMYQIAELTASIEEGKPLPAWAAGAARGATAVMAQRGLGKSSMASAAMVQSLLEAGIPIAEADAQTHSTFALQNLTNKQATALQNANNVAQMDITNATHMQKVQIENAKAFLAMDLKNLDLEQSTNELNYRVEAEAMFNDQAAVNTAAQINAKNELQVQQFYDELSVQVQNANANRIAATQQFNAAEVNAMSQFLTATNNTNDMFNIQMATQIEQANVDWRRRVNTANTAVQNEANRINVQNLLGLQSQAIDQIWQNYRDQTAYIFQMAENEKQRAHQIGMLSLENEFNMDNYREQYSNELALELGGTAIDIIFG